MASTYENDLRLEEMATGENSGSWGTKTNTNLELIADAFSYGTETIANADTTITIADGAADAARSLALKINSSADLTTTRTITLAPNTTSKVWIIENNTSGGQTLTISAGSGSNITLENGRTKIIATDGIGAGSNVVELTQDIAIADLFVDDDLTVGDDIIMNSDGGILKIGADADLQVTHSGSAGTITNATGDLTLDVAGDILLDADGADIKLLNGGTHWGSLYTNSTPNNLYLQNMVSDGDIYLSGSDGGSSINALVLDMSEAGAATFNSTVTANAGVVVDNITIDGTEIDLSSGDLTIDVAGDIILDAGGQQIFFQKGGTTFGQFGTESTPTNFTIESTVSDGDIVFKGNDGGAGITALTLDMSASGDATFNGQVIIPQYLTHAGDGHTYLEFTSDQINLVAGAVEQFRMTAGGGVTVNNAQNSNVNFIVKAGSSANALQVDGSSGAITLNEAGADADFRVESDSNANMLFVDAGTNQVLINNSSGSGVVSINKTSHAQAIGLNIVDTESGNGTETLLNLTNNSDQDVQFKVSQVGATTRAAYIGPSTNTQMNLSVQVGNLNRDLYLDSASLVVNQDSRDYDFRVESDNYSSALAVDAALDRVFIGKSSSGLANAGHELGCDGFLYHTRNGNIMWLNCLASSGNAITFMQNTGTVGSITVSSSGTTYNTTSDRRLKDNIEPIANGTEKLMAMNPVTHTWIADPEADAVHGFIAQEMMDVVPEAVSGEPDGEEMMSMDYGRITPVLVAALQDAHNKITALETRLAKMEAN